MDINGEKNKKAKNSLWKKLLLQFTSIFLFPFLLAIGYFYLNKERKEELVNPTTIDHQRDSTETSTVTEVSISSKPKPRTGHSKTNGNSATENLEASKSTDQDNNYSNYTDLVIVNSDNKQVDGLEIICTNCKKYSSVKTNSNGSIRLNFVPLSQGSLAQIEIQLLQFNSVIDTRNIPIHQKKYPKITIQ